MSAKKSTVETESNTVFYIFIFVFIFILLDVLFIYA